MPAVQAAVQRIEQRLGGEGRVVLRASGTEPVIRVMVEGRDEAETRAAATELAEIVKRAAAGELSPRRCGNSPATCRMRRCAPPLHRYHPAPFEDVSGSQ